MLIALIAFIIISAIVLSLLLRGAIKNHAWGDFIIFVFISICVDVTIYFWAMSLITHSGDH